MIPADGSMIALHLTRMHERSVDGWKTPMRKDHSDWSHALFYVGLALLVCHELDAVARHEWRLLPILNELSDDTGYAAFVALHVPILAALFWLAGHRSDTIRYRSQVTIDLFLLVHAGLHFLLSSQAHYEFSGVVSNTLIYSGSAVGLAHLVLSLRKPSDM